MNSELLRSEDAAGTQHLASAEITEDAVTTFLMFGLGSRIYSTDVSTVREIVDLTEIQQLPNAPHDVLGMIDLRCQSIPVVDLASRMQITADPQEDARIIVFEFGPSDALRLLGIVADRVIGVREIPIEMVETLNHAASGWQGDGVLGVIRSDDTQSLVLRIEHFLDSENQPGEFDFD